MDAGLIVCLVCSIGLVAVMPLWIYLMVRDERSAVPRNPSRSSIRLPSRRLRLRGAYGAVPQRRQPGGTQPDRVQVSSQVRYFATDRAASYASS